MDISISYYISFSQAKVINPIKQENCIEFEKIPTNYFLVYVVNIFFPRWQSLIEY